MVTLVLGVVDVPYDDRGESTSTAQVASWLETKYNVMGTYVELHRHDIEKSLINSMEGALEDLYAGSPIKDPYADAMQEVQAGFRMFLMTGEIEDAGVEGVPTQAALDRKSHRFKNKVSDHARPSFIDTSTYEMSMRAWIDEK